MYRGLAVADQANRIPTAGLEELTAVVLHPDLAGLHPDLREMARERAMTLAFMESSAVAASYPKQVTLADPLPTGVDIDAAHAAGEAALAKHKARLAQAATDERTVADLVQHLAVMFGETPDETLAKVAR
jgi:hypothetical protein